MAKPSPIQLSKLRFEPTPYKKNGLPKIWFVDQQYKLLPFTWNLISDIIKKLIIKCGIKPSLSFKPPKRALSFIVGLLLVGLIIVFACAYADRNYQLTQNQKALSGLHTRLVDEHSIKTSTVEQLKHKKAVEKALRAKIIKLEGKLEAKKASDLAAAQIVKEYKPIAAIAPLPSIVGACGDNKYAQFIYQHESGCNLNAVNSLGCRGIGQACPGSKLPCGADYGCQNAFFTQYANSRYGGWAGAYAAWLRQNWW